MHHLLSSSSVVAAVIATGRLTGLGGTVPGSDLSQDSDYPDEDCVWLLSENPGNFLLGP